MTKYWSHYKYTLSILLKCTNNYYVNPSEKKGLVEKMSPLERNHMRYLLMNDPEIRRLTNNDKQVEIYLNPFLYAFGLV